jgi:hypothetical protein
MPFFVYTIKNNQDSHEPYFGDIIPKINGDQYDDPISDTTIINKVFRQTYYYDCDPSILDQKQLNTFQELLNSPTNYIKNEHNYIHENDKQKIIDLNKQLFRPMNKDKFKNFIIQLHKGHSKAMKYGIYFSLINASDEDNFKEILLSRLGNIRPTAKYYIYYIELPKLLEYVLTIKQRESLLSSLIYININWNKGNFSNTTVKLDNNTVEQFISQITPRHYTSEAELICQIPIPITQFKIIEYNPTSTDQITQYRNKYIKYKYKYSQLKKQIDTKAV